MHIFQFKQYSFEEELWLSEGRAVGSRKEIFAGHQKDPVASLKHLCTMWEPRGGSAVPQSNLGQKDMLRRQLP